MYLDFYNLKEKPFSLTPDPAFLFYSEVHKRAIAFLKYGLQESKGFLQLTGPVGSGKTTLLRAILGELDENTKTAYVINPCATFPDLLRSIMKDLEISNIPETRSKLELLDFFQDYLLVQMKRSNPVVVIFDEAQNLSMKNLEEIRMLSNFETTKDKLLQIVFVGQPELKKILDLPELRQLKQRIQVRYHLAPLNQKEVQEYIDHRLQVAGSNGTVHFDSKACQTIYSFSGGIPRLINSVCDIALLIGYVSEKKNLDNSIVEEAIKELSGTFDEESEGVTAPPIENEEESDNLTKEEIADKDSSENLSAPSADLDEREEDVIQTSPVISDVDDKEPAEIEPTALNIKMSGAADSPSEKTPSEGIGKPREEDRPDNAPKAATATAIDQEPGSKTPEISSGTSGAEKIDRGTSDVRGSADVSELSNEKSPAFIEDSDDGGEQQGAGGVRLRSTLRHGGKIGFKVGGSGIGSPVESQRGIRARIRSALEEREDGKAGVGLASWLNRLLSRNEKKTPATTFREEFVASDYGEDQSETRDDHGRAPRGRPIKRRKYYGPANSTDTKVEILFNDGKTVFGFTKGLSLKDVGFYLTPFEPQDDPSEEFIPFKDIISVRFLQDSEEESQKKYKATGGQPNGRQIITTLVNGEVFEGITPNMFDPECRRFLVALTDRDGGSSWTLIERTGVAGILTAHFTEGIYVEEFETLSALSDLSGKDMEPASQDESTGDFYFSVNDFDAALVAYRKSLDKEGESERLRLKISLGHYNLGLEKMKRNRYVEARSEFNGALKSEHLVKKAQDKLERLEEML